MSHWVDILILHVKVVCNIFINLNKVYSGKLYPNL